MSLAELPGAEKLLIRGKALVYTRDIGADDILPHSYRIAANGDEKLLAQYSMKGVDPDFPSKIQQSGVLVAGRNFGGGSGRAHSSLSLRCAGTKVVVAESFGVIFFRTALNYGLPLLECPGVLETVQEGEEVEVDLIAAEVRTSDGRRLQGRRIHPYLLERIALGGVIPHLRQQLATTAHGKEIVS